MKITTIPLLIALLGSATYAATPEAPAAPGAATAKAAPTIVGTSAAATGAPTDPVNVTATCKDGTAFSGASKKGACSGHKGVRTWGSEAPMATAKTDTALADKAKGQAASAPMATAAAGGGAGKVWVNSKSNTYHCQKDRYYGRTKEGAYMTEADAKAKGAHADHGKACA